MLNQDYTHWDPVLVLHSNVVLDPTAWPKVVGILAPELSGVVDNSTVDGNYGSFREKLIFDFEPIWRREAWEAHRRRPKDT